MYEEPDPGDGTRVLVDRIWPRGLTKAKAALDEWCKDVAPSGELRKWYGHDPARFEEFGRRYRLELEDPERAEALAPARAGERPAAHAAHRDPAARDQRSGGARRAAAKLK